jgi:hypothetical protein
MTHLDALAALSSSGGASGATEITRHRHVRLILVQLTVVTALVLLAALVTRSALRQVALNEGFDPAGVAIGDIDHTGLGDDDARLREADRAVLDAARNAPGVEAAALMTSLPGTGMSVLARNDANDARWVEVHGVTSDFFDTVRLPLLRGRGMTVPEDRDTAPVVVVSASTGAAFWPGHDPIGRRLYLDVGGRSGEVVVVGVSADAGAPLEDAAFRCDVFLPFDYPRAHLLTNNNKWTSASILVRGSRPSAALVETLTTAVGRRVPQADLVSSQMLVDVLAHQTAPARLVGRALAAFGFVGLCIAVVGIYGITSYLTTRRRREFGIRQALGATNVALCRLVATEHAPTMLLGTGAGIALALLVALPLRGRYPTLNPLDGTAVLAVTALILASGFAGVLLPVLQVLHRDPSKALKES